MLKDLTNAPRYHQILTGNFRLGTCIRVTASVYNSEPGGLKNSPPSHEYMKFFWEFGGGGGECLFFCLKYSTDKNKVTLKKYTCIISFWYDSNSIKPISIRHFCPIFHTFLTENINMYVYLYIYHTYCTSQKYFGIKIRNLLK